MTALHYLLSIGVVAISASAAGGTEQVVLKNGSIVTGEVVSVTDGELTMNVITHGRSGTWKLTRDQVDPHSWYVVRSPTLDTASARLDLARFCSENGLFFVAERELIRAAELDPGVQGDVDAELARVRAGAAAKLLALAVTALEDDDVARAESLVANVITRYGDAAQADLARAMVDRVAARKLELERQRAAERANEKVAKEEARRGALLDEVNRKIESARRQNVEALKNRSLSQAQSGFSAAARSFEQALAELERLARTSGDDSALRAGVEALRRTVIQEAIAVQVSYGSTYLVRGSFQTALLHANRALALNPADTYAREFRARVEIASSQGSRRRVSSRRFGR